MFIIFRSLLSLSLSFTVFKTIFFGHSISFCFFCFALQLLVGDIELVSTTHIARTQSSSLHTSEQSALHTAKPIQVDEDDPILEKATKLDHLCTDDRDFFLLESDAVTAEEYAKLSLGSETTDDSHVQQLSLPHCDDSLSTTVSEESECTAAVRVYDLNKRETKILRHDIIKQSRNSIGGESINSFDHLGNCCNATIAVERADSPLQSAIQQFNSRILENVHETRKPPRSPTKLRSVHLNRSPRKLKMADVQLMNDAFGTSLDPKIIDEIKRTSSASVEQVDSSTENGAAADNLVTNDLVIATENLLHSERESSQICGDFVQTECHESNIEQAAEEPAIIVDSAPEVLTQCNESATDDNSNVQIHTEIIENNQVEVNSKPAELPPVIIETTIESNIENVGDSTEIDAEELTLNEKNLRQVTTIYERHHDVIVQVNEHKEKSVIEEEVIPALPSVKELARTFSNNKTDDDIRPERLNRPKVSLPHELFDLFSNYFKGKNASNNTHIYKM